MHGFFANLIDNEYIRPYFLSHVVSTIDPPRCYPIILTSLLKICNNFGIREKQKT